jgi:hypothetical protein
MWLHAVIVAHRVARSQDCPWLLDAVSKGLMLRAAVAAVAPAAVRLVVGRSSALSDALPALATLPAMAVRLTFLRQLGVVLTSSARFWNAWTLL